MKISSWTVIEALMQQNGVNKQQLAAIAGVGPSAVTKWASGGSIRIRSVYRIAKHFGIDPVKIIQAGMEDVSPKVNESETDQLLAGGEGPRQYTPAMLPPDYAADSATASRLASPSFTLTQRERVAQLAVAGYDAAGSRHKAAQYEVLMQHVAGVAEGGESWQWHRDEAANIMDKHFGNGNGGANFEHSTPTKQKE